MVKKGEEKSGIIKRADAGAVAKACKVLVESNYSGPRPYIRILNTSCSFPPLTRLNGCLVSEAAVFSCNKDILRDLLPVQF